MSEQSRMVAPARARGALAAVLAALWALPSAHASLEERIDIGSYLLQGARPSLMLRRAVRSDYSLAMNEHGATAVAGTDALPGNTPFAPEQEDYGFGLDYLYGNSIMMLNYRPAGGADYDEQLFSLGISHEVFGGMTTFKMGLGRGDDTLGGGESASFEESIDRFNYTLGISQVLSRSLLMNVDYATIMDEGFPAAPDRDDVLLAPEIYPETRTSNTVSLSASKSWTPSASTLFGYRYFWDSWDIQAHSWEAEYSNQLENGWLVDLYYRHYTQERASFYSDGFSDELSHMARDRELSTFVSNTLGARFTYPVFRRNKGITRGMLNLSYEIVDYDYDDYTDSSSGSSNPYSFSDDSLHLYFSIWY